MASEKLEIGTIVDGWEIISRQPNVPWLHLLSMIIQTLIIIDYPLIWSTVTWTVRQSSTGTVRNVTARSEQEARKKIEIGTFDESEY